MALGRPHSDEIVGRLIEASFDLVAKGGWINFSLRAAAESIGAAGSAASHRFGDRAGLVLAVGDAAIATESAQMDGFLPGAAAAGPDDLAALLYEWLEQRARSDRGQARVCAELLLAAFRDPGLSHFGPRWAGLCRGLIERLYPAVSDQAARRLAAFLTVEAPCWLLLAEDPQFRLESQESLRRMAQLSLRVPGDLPVSWLKRGLGLPDSRRPQAFLGTKQAIIQATAQLIHEGGALAVTHRAIAKRSGVALSSLTYHFDSLDDLIRHGFQRLFAVDGEQPSSARASVPVYDLVLRALHDPLLAPLAASVRRRLGETAPGASAEADFQTIAHREAAVILTIARELTGEAPIAAPVDVRPTEFQRLTGVTDRS